MTSGKGSEVVRKCWVEMREKMAAGAKRSDWERKREKFFQDRRMDLEMERAREEGSMEFGERDRSGER